MGRIGKYMFEDRHRIEYLGRVTEEDHMMFFLEDIGVSVYLEQYGLFVLYKMGDSELHGVGEAVGAESDGCVRCGRDIEWDDDWTTVILMEEFLTEGVEVSPRSLRGHLARDGPPVDMLELSFDYVGWLCAECHYTIESTITEWLETNTDIVMSMAI